MSEPLAPGLHIVATPIGNLGDLSPRAADVLRRADRILAEVYKKAGAADRYRCSFYPGPHKFDLAMQAAAFAWLARWLAPDEGR